MCAVGVGGGAADGGGVAARAWPVWRVLVGMVLIGVGIEVAQICRMTG